MEHLLIVGGEINFKLSVSNTNFKLFDICILSPLLIVKHLVWSKTELRFSTQ